MVQAQPQQDLTSAAAKVVKAKRLIHEANSFVGVAHRFQEEGSAIKPKSSVGAFHTPCSLELTKYIGGQKFHREIKLEEDWAKSIRTRVFTGYALLEYVRVSLKLR